jgi:Delta7-sterol 5-desaturase
MFKNIFTKNLQVDILPDLSNTGWFFIITIILFVIITVRYFIIAGLFYAIFYVWQRSKWESRKINTKNYQPGQFKTEIIRSIISSLIFAFSGTLLLWLWQNGFAKLYISINAYAWWWLPLSFFIAMAIHETYYYWLHRWMHQPKIFRIVHKWHHDSHIASPWTAFSFHPLESIIQALFLPLLLLFLPVNVFVLIAMLVIMSVSSVINHLDIEIYPEWFMKNRIGKWFIGSTHHAMHHKQYKYNFGLYFTCWDIFSKTESPSPEKIKSERKGY